MSSRTETKRSLEGRLRSMNGRAAASGRPVGWQFEALDAYLDGMSLDDIAAIFECGYGSMRNTIQNAALVRLMAAKKAEQASEIEELKRQEGSET